MSSMPRPKVRVAAVQAAPVSFDLHATLRKVELLATRAARPEGGASGAELVLFPEAFCSAYPRGMEFIIGSRSDDNRTWFRKYLQSAVRVPDPTERAALASEHLTEDHPFYAFQALGNIAKKLGIHLSIGVVERSNTGATLWCTNLVFGPSGALLYRHRKLQPTAAERIVWSQGEALNPGGEDNLPVVTTPVGRLGGLICWENLMPLARYVLYRKGVEIYLAPTADPRPTWPPMMQHIAQEGRCYVISANQFQTPHDFPEDFPPRVAGYTGAAKVVNGNKEETEVWSAGGSCIVDPLGQILAGPLWNEEGILTAELDMDYLDAAHLDFDAAGHYSRHDLLVPLVNAS